MATVATVQDVATSLGRPITDTLEVAQVTLWLTDAETLIGARLGNVSLLNQGVLKYVEREAVILKLRNPGGYQSETIDDYTYRRNPDAAQGRILILDEWWDLLITGGSNPSFSVTPSGDPYYASPGSIETLTDELLGGTILDGGAASDSWDIPS